MHIELKKWQETDFASIAEIFTHADRSYLTDALPMPYTAEHARSWHESVVSKKDGKSGIFRIIFVDEKPAGQISIDQKDDVFSCDSEIGYILKDEYKGRGIMTEAVKYACEEAFRQLNIQRISAAVFSPNIASMHVLEKNGFHQEGIIKNAVCKNGNLWNLVLYGKQK